MSEVGLIWLALLLFSGVGLARDWRPQLRKSGPPNRNQTPLDILRLRYASGEIDREQYDKLRQALEL